ncbi:DUF3152 domain-containing protein [Streptomyces fructofermentans]|uniref:DUF3152 domain-containing protein n=1 Tax=Streptomyces fructofermentans TaxID=152141 RepID=UPI0033E5DDA5
MGRHSRRGPAPKGDAAATPKPPVARPEAGQGAERRRAPGVRQPQPPPPGTPAGGVPRLPEGWAPRRQEGPPGRTAPRPAGGPPPGAPRFFDGTPAGGVPRLPDGTPAHGFPRLPDGTPAHGFPRLPDGTPAHGFPRTQDGTPARGFPRLPDGGPAYGSPGRPDGTPARGAPRVRGGHPEQRETGGGWGRLWGGPPAGPGGTPQGPPQNATRGPVRGTAHGVQQAQGVDQVRPGHPGPMVPRQQRSAPGGGPRQAYVDAFDEDDDLFTAHSATTTALRADPRTDVAAPGTGWDDDEYIEHRVPPRGPRDPRGGPEKAGGGKGRAFTGVAAAAVITVLAVVVAGQVVRGDGDVDEAGGPRATSDTDRETKDTASRTDKRPAPSAAAKPVTLSYGQRMAKKYELAADLKGSGEFEAVPGLDRAPGKGRKYTYRVDVEKGLGLDPRLFARAVQTTLNDDRSWAHDGGRTFERISSGEPDFVITLASPGTTAFWCAKSGLDTTEDNVSCDSAATDRVMINAYRWAQGSRTYGAKMYAYRQMLINHEIGHRLGYGHVTCDSDGALAPVMQQQTKFLDHDGISCRPNPWAFPDS